MVLPVSEERQQCRVLSLVVGIVVVGVVVVGIVVVGVVVGVVVVGVGNGTGNGIGNGTGNVTGGCHSLSSESISSPARLWFVVGGSVVGVVVVGVVIVGVSTGNGIGNGVGNDVCDNGGDNKGKVLLVFASFLFLLLFFLLLESSTEEALAIGSVEVVVEVGVGVVVIVVRSGCVCWWPPGLVARSGDATTGFRALWLIGCVDSGGVECVCCAGRPPLFERSDGATTLLETVAAGGSSIDEVINEEDRSLPGVGPGVGGAAMAHGSSATR